MVILELLDHDSRKAVKHFPGFLSQGPVAAQIAWVMIKNPNLPVAFSGMEASIRYQLSQKLRIMVDFVLTAMFWIDELEHLVVVGGECHDGLYLPLLEGSHVIPDDLSQKPLLADIADEIATVPFIVTQGLELDARRNHKAGQALKHSLHPRVVAGGRTGIEKNSSRFFRGRNGKVLAPSTPLGRGIPQWVVVFQQTP
jgi:hypothetical protein